MSAIKKMDRDYRKALKDFEAAWSKEYEALREEASEEIERLKKENAETAAAMEKFAKDYKTRLEAINKKYEKSINDLTSELKTKYNEDRKNLELTAEEFREATDLYLELTEKLEEDRERIQKAAESVLQEYEHATDLLKQDIDERCSAAMAELEEAKEKDPRISEHSYGETDTLPGLIENIRDLSELDKYYHYGEMLILSRRLSDLENDIGLTLKMAEENARLERIMTGIKEMILTYLNSNSKRYTIMEQEHNPPWGTYFIQFHDQMGNVYRIFADERGLQSEVWAQRDDKKVNDELKLRIDTELEGVYRENDRKVDMRANVKAGYILAESNRRFVGNRQRTVKRGV